jgi:ABC-type Fe3+ transport system substrate-binding protein
LLKQSSTAAVALISGEVDILVIGNEHDLLRRNIEGEPVGVIYPREGLVFKTSPVGICAKAPHPNAAKLWIDWESGPEAQAIASKVGGYAGILKDMKPYYPRDPKVINPENMLALDAQWFRKNKKKLMKKFGKIMSQK